ncbi:hypothetical protein [Dysgonomonas sp. BGC7]|uniref:hypothetical protein n=1 Tax=Dysgonomonas sp. BGC7 TaxID=1658008 RepID=UPI000680B98B|nr:hypothetical protein [Dysgonomonas sp. BGC7]MBD8389469.1 hypothetical protein [Dysgonomonas sp. BGC7]
MIKYFSFILLFLYSTWLCATVQADTLPVKIPEGAVPVKSFKNNIIFQARINDSIPIKALFDIGAWGLAVPEKWRKNKDKPEKYEQIRLEVGSWTKTMFATFLLADSQFLNWYGDDCVLLGWDFFNRRIIEVSYNYHYVKELTRRELNEISGYDVLKIENRGRRLLVDGEVIIDGQKIAGKYWLDTGLNGTMFLAQNILSKYGLNAKLVKSGKAKNLDSDKSKINLIMADTIRVGNSILTRKDIIFSNSEWFVFKENNIYVGLIGNQFFKNFSVIFDFQENNLYLKPIEN